METSVKGSKNTTGHNIGDNLVFKLEYIQIKHE